MLLGLLLLILFNNCNIGCCNYSNLNEDNQNNGEQYVNKIKDKGIIPNKNNPGITSILPENKTNIGDIVNKFLSAQNDGSNYSMALNEIKSGKKNGHWIWYIFPQVSGLIKNPSIYNIKYSLNSIDEILIFLRNKTLRNRIVEITKALIDCKNKYNKCIRDIVDDDDVKIKSSMTMFYLIVCYLNKNADPDINNDDFYILTTGDIKSDNSIIFKKALDIYFNGGKCVKSEQIINNWILNK